MKTCGKRFHDEVGKFRFLNELIKVVSPKVRPSAGSVPALMEAAGGRSLGAVQLGTQHRSFSRT